MDFRDETKFKKGHVKGANYVDYGNMFSMQNMDNLMKPIPSEIKILYDAFLVKKVNSFCILRYPQDIVIIVKNKNFMRFDSSLFSPWRYVAYV